MKLTLELLNHTHSTSQKAWEYINKMLFIKEKELGEIGQGRNGNCTMAYNVNMFIKSAWVDPEIDFANLFGYKTQKWSSLINNYVDLDQLDVIKAEIREREAKKQKNYTVSTHFKNEHNSGKACLLTLTFTRRQDWDIPVLYFHVRASEVTKRLLLDFLLVQRMGEYVYGNKQTFSIHFSAPVVYIAAESFVMFHTQKDLRKLAKKEISELQPMQKKVLDILEKFSNIDPLTLTYRVHRRSVRQLQRNPDGTPISGAPPLQAKNLFLHKPKEEYPEDLLTDKARKKYKKEKAL